MAVRKGKYGDVGDGCEDGGGRDGGQRLRFVIHEEVVIGTESVTSPRDGDLRGGGRQSGAMYRDAAIGEADDGFVVDGCSHRGWCRKVDHLTADYKAAGTVHADG